MFAASAQAPITALLIIFELTGNYQIILPPMFAIVVATAVANAITKDNIYTLKLRRRGIDIDARPARLMSKIKVGQAMGRPPAVVGTEARLEQMVARFAAEHSDSLPVVDLDGKLLGVVAAVDVERVLSDGDGHRLVAGSLAREAPRLHAGDSLEDAIAALAAADYEGVPVLEDSDGQLVGWLTHRRLLGAYQDRAGRDGG